MRTMYIHLIIPLWCSSLLMTPTNAFSPSGSTFKSVLKRNPSSDLFGLGDRDFEKIFGKQEDNERRIRDLAREYHPPPKSVVDELYSNADQEENSGDFDNKQMQQQQRTAEKTSVTEKNDGIKKKYVPPYKRIQE